jgi:thiol-disulfide isomerase/thioredoxin
MKSSHQGISRMFRASQPRFGRRASLGAKLVALALFLTASLHAASGPPETTFASDLAGKPLDPFAVARGRVVVLLFIRTDCPISNRYAPLLETLSERYQGKAAFWLVYPDRSESASQIRVHLEDFHYSIPALRDTRHALVKRSQATITPEAAVFDASGRLLYHGRIDNRYEDFGRARAAATTHELEDSILAALEGKPPAAPHAKAVGCYISDLE